MVALGAANIFGSFFRIYPTFGSLPRSFIANMCEAFVITRVS
jgi:MFS superfamily sulfate permease-like transporter